MRVCNFLECPSLACSDVRCENYVLPHVEVHPEKISLVLISEAAPAELKDYYDAGEEALFLKTTLQAFNDAGAGVSSQQDLLDLGIYLTTAVKCGKTGYGIGSKTIETCSHLLEQELALFPNAKAYLLMGDVAIKSLNSIARRAGGKRVVPAGSTYKIRGGEFYFQEKRVFPSYLQAGPCFYIEKSKRAMIREDLAKALSLIR